MKRLLCLSLAAFCSSQGFSQITLNNTLETGITIPVNGNSVNSSHNGNGIHIGNHLDLLSGAECLSWGIGAYLGHTGSLGVDNKYKEEGSAIATKYRLAASQLNFSSTPFQSTQFLLGPVVGLGAGNFNMRLWAKGGIGINQAGTYAVIYREGNTDQKVYVNGSTENRNGLAYDLGAGFSCLLSRQLGFQVSGSYNSAKTDMVNYNYDREKGTSPSYTSSKNTFIKASIALVFHLHSITSPRDAASGMPTGRRMHKPYRSGAEEETTAYEAREVGSGMATGKRMHKPIVITRIEEDDDVYVLREAGSGMATGRRMHKPIVITRSAFDTADAAKSAVNDNPLYESNGNHGENPLFEGKGLKTTSPRDGSSGMATGRRMHDPIVITKELDAVIIVNIGNDPVYIVVENAVHGNPLYNDSGLQGNNPMHQAKGITQSGIKRSELSIDPAAKGIQEAGVAKTVNTSRGNIKRIDTIILDGDDATIECIVEENGKEYKVTIKGKTGRRVEVLKSN